MATLFEDNFEGNGTLLSHVADTGQGWMNRQDAGDLVVGDGGVYRQTGFSSSASVTRVDTSFNLGGEVELQAEIEVTPGTVLGTLSVAIYVGDDDTTMALDLLVSTGGWCRVTGGGSSPVYGVVTRGEAAPRTHTFRIVGTIGSSAARLYANGVLVGDFTMYGPLATDVFVGMLFYPNVTYGYVPLIKVRRVTLIGSGAVVGEFWANIIRAAETP